MVSDAKLINLSTIFLKNGVAVTSFENKVFNLLFIWVKLVLSSSDYNARVINLRGTKYTAGLFFLLTSLSLN